MAIHIKLALVLFALCVSSCFYNKEDLVVPGNVAPPDPTVSSLVKESYVNRIYISVLGRKPLEEEFAQSVQILNKEKGLPLDVRKEFLQRVFSRPEYFDRLFDLARTDLLNGADTMDVLRYIFIIEDQLQRAEGDVFRAVLQYELDRLQKLREVPQALRSGNIDVVEMHRRCLDNLLYDEINMGTENFVVSVFQNLLFRYPTADPQIDDNELANAKLMVEGFEAILFFNLGNSKSDFLNIFLSSTDYFEGQVRHIFNRFLFREPTSVEMTDFVLHYIDNRDYEDLQIQILASDEYLGI